MTNDQWISPTRLSKRLREDTSDINKNEIKPDNITSETDKITTDIGISDIDDKSDITWEAMQERLQKFSDDDTNTHVFCKSYGSNYTENENNPKTFLFRKVIMPIIEETEGVKNKRKQENAHLLVTQKYLDVCQLKEATSINHLFYTRIGSGKSSYRPMSTEDFKKYCNRMIFISRVDTISVFNNLMKKYNEKQILVS